MSSQRLISILDVRDSPWVDGPGRTILETARNIDRTRFKFVMSGFSAGADCENIYLDTAKQAGADIVRIIEKGTFDYSIAKQIHNIVLRRQIDFIHTHEFRSNLYGLLAARMAKVPIMSTCHGWITNSWKQKVFKWLDKLVLARMDFVTVVSDRIKSELVQRPTLRQKVQTLPNALVLEHYIRKGRRDRFRSVHGLDATDIVIAKIGRLSPEKNQISLIRAVAILSRKFENIKLLIIGIGPDENKLRSEVERLSADRCVQFLGYQPDMLSVYEGTDLVVQSSLTEGMPNVVLEALAMEVPMIATNVGGTAEIIETGVSGTLISNAEPPTLMMAIEDFIANQSKYEAMTSEGRKTIISHFSFTERTRALEGIYQRLVAA